MGSAPAGSSSEPPADPPDAHSADASASPSPASSPIPAPSLAAPAGRTCAHCGSPLAGTQDWCTQCGGVVPGVLAPPRWRSPAAILAVLVVLAIAAAGAAYAALNQHSPKRATVTRTVAAATVPATTAPTATTPATPEGGAAAGSGFRKLPKLPLHKFRLPKIPLTALTPTSKAKAPATKKPASTEAGGTEPGSSSKTSKEREGAEGAGGAAPEAGQPKAILLDTNAASTYNPYNLPAAYFGDPSLTIDGDTSTAWTAEVPPASAPGMAEGLLFDLKSHQKLSVLELDSSTVGMTVQVYGTASGTVPDSILASEWAPLSSPRTLTKRVSKIKLRSQKRGVRYIALWISRAPTSAAGTPEAPGHVSVQEVELFPAA